MGKLFIPCNKRVQNKWTEWAQYIMLLVIEPQSPESGLSVYMLEASFGKQFILWISNRFPYLSDFQNITFYTGWATG